MCPPCVTSYSLHAFISSRRTSRIYRPRFLEVRACTYDIRNNNEGEGRLIKMALRLSTHGKCSCVSPDDFMGLSLKERQGAHNLVQEQKFLSVFLLTW